MNDSLLYNHYKSKLFSNKYSERNSIGSSGLTFETSKSPSLRVGTMFSIKN